MTPTRDLLRSLLTLEREGRTGLLEVKKEAARTFIHLRGGTPIFSEDASLGETLGRLLMRQNLITQEQYREAIDRMTDAIFENEQMRFGEVLVQLGYLSAEQVQKALGDQVRWKIVRCIQWDEPTFEFDETSSRSDGVGNFPSPVRPLALAAARWFDPERIEKLLGPEKDRFPSLLSTPDSIAAAFALSNNEKLFVAGIDGARTLGAYVAAPPTGVDPQSIFAAFLMTDALTMEASATLKATPVVPPIALPHKPTPYAAFAPIAPSAVAREKTNPTMSVPTSPSTKLPAVATRPQFAVPAPVASAPVAPAPVAPAAAPPPATASAGFSTATRPQFVVPGAPPASRPRAASSPDHGGAARDRAETALKRLLAGRSSKPTATPAEKPVSEKDTRLLAEQAFQSGKQHMHAGRIDAALAAFRRAADAFSNAKEYRIYAMWAEFMAASGDRSLELRYALKELSAVAVKEDPQLGFARYVLGRIALLENDDDAAERLFRYATKLDPTLTDADRYVRLILSRRQESPGKSKEREREREREREKDKERDEEDE